MGLPILVAESPITTFHSLGAPNIYNNTNVDGAFHAAGIGPISLTPPSGAKLAIIEFAGSMDMNVLGNTGFLQTFGGEGIAPVQDALMVGYDSQGPTCWEEAGSANDDEFPWAATLTRDCSDGATFWVDLGTQIPNGSPACTFRVQVVNYTVTYVF